MHSVQKQTDKNKKTTDSNRSSVEPRLCFRIQWNSTEISPPYVFNSTTILFGLFLFIPAIFMQINSQLILNGRDRNLNFRQFLSFLVIFTVILSFYGKTRGKNLTLIFCLLYFVPVELTLNIFHRAIFNMAAILFFICNANQTHPKGRLAITFRQGFVFFYVFLVKIRWQL